MSEDFKPLSEKMISIDKIIYAHEGAKKLGSNGIAGNVIFLKDVKEAVEKLKEIIGDKFGEIDELKGMELREEIDKIFGEFKDE